MSCLSRGFMRCEDDSAIGRYLPIEISCRSLTRYFFPSVSLKPRVREEGKCSREDGINETKSPCHCSQSLYLKYCQKLDNNSVADCGG